MPRSTPASGIAATPTTPATPRPRARAKAKPPAGLPLDATVPATAPASASAPASVVPTDADASGQRLERIRVAAYGRYAARGMQGGHEVEDWLEAEREIDRQDASTGP